MRSSWTVQLKYYPILLTGLLILGGWRVAWSLDDDVYGDESFKIHKEEPRAPEEKAVVLPPYPRPEKLIEVDLRLRDFPFALLIDPASLDVDEQGVVRYTAVLRSASGAENIVYEGIRCTQRQYRRYAYGAQGSFHLVSGSQWQFLRRLSQDRYRAALMDDYFCPLPSGDRTALILRKLKYPVTE